MNVNFGDIICSGCSSRNSYIFTPKKPTRCNLELLHNKLKLKGIAVYASTPHLLVVKHLSTKVSFFINGKTIVGTLDKNKAKQILMDLNGD